MAVKWTEKQQQVIHSRNRNLLVSAAAGSGKTAVLVERIIRMISEGEHPLNIDQLLVMTFTNAAGRSGGFRPLRGAGRTAAPAEHSRRAGARAFRK